MAMTFHLDVVTAEQQLFSGTVEEVIAPGVLGDLGILPRHSQLISKLRAGELQYKTTEGTMASLFVSGGVLEVQPHLVTVLADTAVRAHDLDEAKILDARRHAEQTLQNQKANIDTSAALVALAESLAQLQTLQKFKNRA